MADTTDYTGRITSEHSDKPKYMAMVDATVQPLVDALNVSNGLPVDFDLDSAVGVQLDQVGLWIGIGRRINTPLTGVYFSFDTEGLGFNHGVWKGPFDPDTGVIELDDETYRLLLRAKIAANHWDGTMETSKPILDAVFNPRGGSEFIDVTANNETFAVGDGVSTEFQLRYQGQAVYTTSSMTIYRTDWQGQQQLYSTPRTNNYLFNQDLSNAYWGKGAGSISSAGTVGDVAVFKFTPDTANAGHLISRAVSMPSGSTVNISWIAKADGYKRLSVRVAPGGPILGRVLFDVLDGFIAQNNTGITADIEPFGDGFFRFSVTFPLGTGVTGAGANLEVATDTNGLTFAGDGASGVLLSSPQIEIGLMTSIIKTEASAVTVIDYAVQPFNNIVLPAPLPAGAQLSWSGEGTAYAAGTYAFIEDNQDMSMTIGIAGTIPSAIALALISGGYISLKPCGVQANYYIATSVDNAPLFGFDIDNGVISGFDKGAWGTSL
ncbi:DUF2612 domain-containing protein [Pseudomonas putida]|uniref:DUF2612 domain-containing protein n=1 Tax=Pseudomonas putida TaxID=303 RepID=UPI002363B3E3|nr:DUF2612 domain-containing protein [Pseudomonas putida]MDD2056624.1 DUF2612 domain-containing protein [Pseudomonas putida]